MKVEWFIFIMEISLLFLEALQAAKVITHSVRKNFWMDCTCLFYWIFWLAVTALKYILLIFYCTVLCDDFSMKNTSVPLCFFIWNLSFHLTLNIKSIKNRQSIRRNKGGCSIQPATIKYSSFETLAFLPFVSLEFTEPLVFNIRQTVA